MNDGLRKRAEALLAKSAVQDNVNVGDLISLLQELHIHQIELSLQNDELIQAQTRLEEARKQYFELFHLAPVSYLTLDSQGKILDLNLAACRLLGFVRQKVINRPLSVSFTPDSRPIFFRHLNDVFEQSEQVRDEVSLISRSGETFIVEIISDQYMQDNQPLCRMMILDITERRQAEQKLQESETRFRYIANQAPVIIWMLDTAEKPIFFNHTWQKFIGRQGVSHTNEWASLIHPEDRTRWLEIHADAVMANQPYSIEYRVLRHDRAYRWVQQVTIPRFSSDNTFEGYICTLQDITDLVTAKQILTEDKHILESNILERTHELEEANRMLRDSEAFLQSTIDAQLSYINVLDSNGNVIRVNEAWKQAARANMASDMVIEGVGYNYFELCENTLGTQSDRDRAHEISRLIRELLNHERKAFEIEYLFDTPSGERWFMMHGSRFLKDGLPHVLLTHTNITHQKQLQNELNKAYQKEKRLNEMRTRFINLVSHEFRTPMAIMQTSVDMLRRYADHLDVTKRAAQLDKIENQLRRLTEILDDTTFINQWQSVGIHVRPQPLDFDQFLRRLIDEAQVAANVPVHITMKGFENIPHTIKLDEMLMRQVFMNLISNAIKYSYAEGEIEISVNTDNDHTLTIKVVDHGVGISEIDQVFLFTPFHRGANVENIRGTGLGLVIAKQSIEAHGGSINVTSTLGQGTTVTVRLPIV